MKTLLFLTLFLSTILISTSQAAQPTSFSLDTSQPIDSPCETSECAPSVLLPFTPYKIAGIILIVLIGGLANATGIGGGAKLNPVLLIFFDYNKNTVITIVFSLIFGSALGNFVNVVRRRDPKTGKPLINYDLALLCMPLMMLGTNLGVILGRVSASFIIAMGIVAVCVNNFVKIYAKAKKQYRQETEQKKIQEASNPSEVKIERGEANLVGGNYSSTSVEELEDSPQIKEVPALVPVKKVAILTGLIVTIMFLSVIRGTKNQPSVVGIPYCGAGYWLIFGVALAVCFVVSCFCQRILKREIRMREQRQTQVHKKDDDFELAESSMKRLTILSLITGVIAGILGIGGGLILSPIFLSLGVGAQSLAATTGFFVLQTSFISLFLSYLYRDVLLSEQVFFFLIALVGSFAVSTVLSYLVKKYNRSSVLLFILLGVVVLSIVATPSYEVWKNWEDLPQMFEFNSVC